jgi:ADP-ribose pyrophosphatase
MNGAKSVTLKQRRRACGNRLFDVYLDHLAHADGTEVRDYLVVAPTQVSGDLVSGVSVMPVLDGQIGLLRVYRHAVARSVWEVPRGFLDANETAEQAAERELDEETGLGVHPGAMRGAGFIAPEAGLLTARVQIFIAERCFRRRTYSPAESGHEALEWFTPARFLSLVEQSEIEDPSTLVAFFRSGFAVRD